MFPQERGNELLGTKPGMPWEITAGELHAIQSESAPLCHQDVNMVLQRELKFWSVALANPQIHHVLKRCVPQLHINAYTQSSTSQSFYNPDSATDFTKSRAPLNALLPLLRNVGYLEKYIEQPNLDPLRNQERLRLEEMLLSLFPNRFHQLSIIFVNKLFKIQDPQH